MSTTEAVARWATPSELADFLGVTLSWVYARTYRGARDPLPYKRVGRWLRFDLEEVKRWVAERTQRELDERLAAQATTLVQPPRDDRRLPAGDPLPFRVAKQRTGSKKLS